MALLLSAVSFVLAAFIIVINTLALISLAKLRSLRTPSNIHIISLAVGDLMIGLVLALLSMLMAVHDRYTNTAMCAVCEALLLIALEVTVLESFTVSVDRYLAISRPYFYEKHVTDKRVKLSVICVWVLAALISGTVLVIQIDHHSSMSRCGNELPLEAVIVIAPTFYLSIPVCGIMYALISRVALHYQRRIALQRVTACAQHVPLRESFLQKLKATKLFCVVFGLLFVLWMPLMTRLVLGTTSMEVSVIFKQASVMLCCLNSCLNVFVYLFLHRDFRAAFKRLLMRRY